MSKVITLWTMCLNFHTYLHLPSRSETTPTAPAFRAGRSSRRRPAVRAATSCSSSSSRPTWTRTATPCRGSATAPAIRSSPSSSFSSSSRSSLPALSPPPSLSPSGTPLLWGGCQCFVPTKSRQPLWFLSNCLSADQVFLSPFWEKKKQFSIFVGNEFSKIIKSGGKVEETLLTVDKLWE